MARLRPLGDEVVVERDGEAGAAGQRDQAGELGAAQQIEGQEDVVQAGIGHDLGLAQLLAGDADGTQLDLAAGELRQLVGLDVGTELQPVRVGIILRAAEVGLDPVEVDEHGRGVEVVDHPGHGGAPLRQVMVAPPSGGGKPDRRLRRGASHGYSDVRRCPSGLRREAGAGLRAQGRRCPRNCRRRAEIRRQPLGASAPGKADRGRDPRARRPAVA